MTNKEALIAALQLSVPDNTVEKSLIDAGVDGSVNYTSSNSTAIDLCAIEVLQGILTTPNISEGGYSVSYDREAVRLRISFLSQRAGVSGIATISNASNRW